MSAAEEFQTDSSCSNRVVGSNPFKTPDTLARVFIVSFYDNLAESC